MTAGAPVAISRSRTWTQAAQGFVWLLACQYAGIWLARIAPIGLPGTVIGMLLLLTLFNDALRGLPLNMTQDNLQAMTRQAQAAGAQVVLLGMQMPPNYGPDMAKQFEAAYAQVAKSQKAALVPFFLKGIGDDPDPLKWFQADRIHPNEAAQPRMLANVWPTLKKQLK